MHDIHGRKIDVGDVVIAKCWATGYNPEPVKVIGCMANTETCNLQVISYEPRIPVMTVTAKETLLVIKQNGNVVPVPVEA